MYKVSFQRYVPLKKTLITYQIDHSRALPPAFSHVASSAHTTKTRVHFLLGFAVDFVKFSDAGEAFFIRCFTVMFPKAQSIYWSFALNLSSISDSTLSVVNLRQRRNSALVNSVCETALGLHLCTRIWVRAMIGLLKKPLSICQSRRKEIWNALPVILWVLWGPAQRYRRCFADLIVCYTAVFSVVTQR